VFASATITVLWLSPLSAFREQRIRLIIDTTKLGFYYRMMTVSIAYRRRALPLVWSVHRGKKGWVTAKKQIALFRWVAELIPTGSEVWVTGDCEFQSVPLISWFEDQGWHYVLRQQGKIKVWSPDQPQAKLASLDLQEGETRYLGWVYLTEKHHYGPVSVVLHWEAGEDEPWYLATDQAATWRTIQMYKVRMWTEEMYGDMKGHGFDLEATHLQDLDRLSRLVLCVSALCLADFLGKLGRQEWTAASGGSQRSPRQELLSSWLGLARTLFCSRAISQTTFCTLWTKVIGG
jgi:hypothetical protein